MRRIVTGKQWNYRTVAAQLHQDHLDYFQEKFIQEYQGDGIPAMRTYAAALTALWEELSEEDQTECKQTAVRWNIAPPPKEVQQK